MKKRLLIFLAAILCFSHFSSFSITVFAQTADVTADEGWENATYDPSNRLLTNVDGGYSFKVNGSTLQYNGSAPVNAEHIVIPSSYNGIKITTVDSYVLNGRSNATSSAKSIIVSEGITRLSDNCFRNLENLVSINLPSTLNTIGDNSFADCASFEDFVLSNDNTAFTTDGRVLYSADKSVLYAYPAMLQSSSFTVPQSVSSLKPYAFSDARNLTEITFPENCSITELPAYCFHQCENVIDLKIPKSVTSLGNFCFNECKSLVEMVVPSGITVLPDYCFIWCINLKTLTFMGNITEFKQFSCGRLYALEELKFMSKTAPSVLGRVPFYGLPSSCIVYYPSNGTGYTDEAFRSIFNASQIYETLIGTPEAIGVQITGSGVIGQSVTGIYGEYYDPSNRPESGSVYTWERADDSAFTKNVTVIESGNILAGQSKTYTPTSEDEGKYIRFGVTAKNADIEDNTGETVYAYLSSSVRQPITVPAVSLISPYNGYKMHQNTALSLLASATCDNVEITKIEYYANNELIASSNAFPFESSWTPLDPGTYEIYAVAYNSIGEIGKSGIVSIKVYSLDESIESVSAEKWAYDFNSFTANDIYTSDTGLTLPGDLPPAVSIGAGATVTSASGIYGKNETDHCLEINSIEGNTSGVNISYDLSKLDAPINNVMFEAEIAVNSATETRNLFYYSTPKGKYISFQLGSDGSIGYYTDYDARVLKKIKDENGQNIQMQVDTWYKFGLLLDFQNGKLTFYMNDEELETIDCAAPYGFTSVSSVQIQNNHRITGNTATAYIDNLKLYQVQDSYVTSVITSPKDNNYFLTGSDVVFEGYAKDSRPGKAIDHIEIYANDTLINTVNGDSYSFIKNDLAPGKYTVTAKAISSDGLVGYSSSHKLTVSAASFPSTYGDDMLLQRNKELRLFGYGIDGAKVTASILGYTASATVLDGTWTITLPPLPTTKSTTLSISTNDGVTTVFNNVAVGELILCSGQSNVQLSLDKFSALKGEADKDYPDIRFYQQTVTSAKTPQTENETGRWQTATVFNSYEFSVYGYLTAKEFYLSQNGEVPVGVIYAAYGGSSINMWAPNDSFKNHPDTTSLSSGSTYYNKTVAPWTNFTIGHIIWYQGESNSNLTTPYEHMLTALIDGWREDFNDDTINVIVVMLPIYDYPAAFGGVRSAVGIRDAQWNVCENLENVETVVGIDTGEARNIHPSDKIPLAKRASLILEHFTNPDDTELVWKSPSFDKAVYDKDNNKVILYFKDTADGLKTSDNQPPRGFKIAGDDGVFKDIEAVIENNTIVIDTSSVIGTPKIRYAWESAPAGENGKSIINLVNSAGLPAAPFRTDRDVYHFKVRNDDGTYLEPINFSPITRDLTVSTLQNGKVTISVQAYDCEDSVTKTEIYCDGKLLGEAKPTGDNNYYTYTWTDAKEGTYSFYAVAYDEYGLTSLSNGSKTVMPKTYSFTISEQKNPLINLSGSFEQGITASAENADNCVLIVAAYRDGIITYLDISPSSKTINVSSSLIKDTNKVQAFLFEDTISIKPVCNTVCIEK